MKSDAKYQLISAILDQDTYMRSSRMYKGLEQALLKLSVNHLSDLKLIVDLKAKKR